MNYLRYYGRVRISAFVDNYAFRMTLNKRWSKPYAFRLYYASRSCTAGQWFDIIVTGWGGSVLGVGAGFAAMWTGVGAIGGAVSFTWGMYEGAWAFADTVSCLTRGSPAL